MRNCSSPPDYRKNYTIAGYWVSNPCSAPQVLDVQRSSLPAPFSPALLARVTDEMGDW